MNISFVHAIQSARGLTMRITPNRVKRMSGTVHIYLPCLPNLKVQPRELNCPLADPTPFGDLCIYIYRVHTPEGLFKI